MKVFADVKYDMGMFAENPIPLREYQRIAGHEIRDKIWGLYSHSDYSYIGWTEIVNDKREWVVISMKKKQVYTTLCDWEVIPFVEKRVLVNKMKEI